MTTKLPNNSIIPTIDPYIFMFTSTPIFRELDPVQNLDDKFWVDNLQGCYEQMVLPAFRAHLARYVNANKMKMPKGKSSIVDMQKDIHGEMTFKIVLAPQKINVDWLKKSESAFNA